METWSRSINIYIYSIYSIYIYIFIYLYIHIGIKLDWDQENCVDQCTETGKPPWFWLSQPVSQAQGSSAGLCVRHITPHCEQGWTQQSTTQRRQSFEVARCRLRYIYWKTWTTRRANIDHKHKTRHREDGFHRATHKEKNLIEESGCWLLPQGSSVAGPQLTQTVRLSSIAVPLAPAPDDACAKSAQSMRCHRLVLQNLAIQNIQSMCDRYKQHDRNG